MVIVYYKGIFDQTFGSLIDAENYVHTNLENDCSQKDEDYSYDFY